MVPYHAKFVSNLPLIISYLLSLMYFKILVSVHYELCCKNLLQWKPLNVIRYQWPSLLKSTTWKLPVNVIIRFKWSKLYYPKLITSSGSHTCNLKPELFLHINSKRWKELLQILEKVTSVSSDISDQKYNQYFCK